MTRMLTVEKTQYATTQSYFNGSMRGAIHTSQMQQIFWDLNFKEKIKDEWATFAAESVLVCTGGQRAWMAA